MNKPDITEQLYSTKPTFQLCYNAAEEIMRLRQIIVDAVMTPKLARIAKEMEVEPFEYAVEYIRLVKRGHIRPIEEKRDAIGRYDQS